MHPTQSLLFDYKGTTPYKGRFPTARLPDDTFADRSMLIGSGEPFMLNTGDATFATGLEFFTEEESYML
eukprot:SAG31_NODE_24781_length_474_cov_0.917333_1_plen_68_part_10